MLFITVELRQICVVHDGYVAVNLVLLLCGGKTSAKLNIMQTSAAAKLRLAKKTMPSWRLIFFSAKSMST